MSTSIHLTNGRRLVIPDGSRSHFFITDNNVLEIQTPNTSHFISPAGWQSVHVWGDGK